MAWNKSMDLRCKVVDLQARAFAGTANWDEAKYNIEVSSLLLIKFIKNNWRRTKKSRWLQEKKLYKQSPVSLCSISFLIYTL